jgi:hypothetical protein
LSEISGQVLAVSLADFLAQGQQFAQYVVLAISYLGLALGFLPGLRIEPRLPSSVRPCWSGWGC